MLRKCAAVLAVVSCLTYATSARAEPGPVEQWLMNEPASLFDLGMLRVELQLDELKDYDELKDRLGALLFYSSYNWDKNRIYLSGAIFGASPEIDGKHFCKLIISNVRKIGGIKNDGSTYGDHSIFDRAITG